MAKNKIIITFTLGIAFSLILYRAYNISMFEKSSRRSYLRGDAYSDINLYSGVKYFNDSGLKKTVGLPVHYYKVPLADTCFHPTAYTHYPALPDILAYTYSIISGTINEFVLRCFVIVLSLVFVWFLFLVCQKIIPNYNMALLGWCLVILSNYFIGFADSLHKHLYEELFKVIFLFVLLKYIDKPKVLHLVFLFFTMVLVSNISFEPIVYLAVVCVGVSLVNKLGLFSKLNIVVALAAFVGVLLHFYQNICYFDSWELALKDLTDTAKLRTSGTEIANGIKKLEEPFGLQQLILLPFTWLNRIERFFAIPAFALIIIWFLVKQELKKQLPKNYFNWCLILLIASFAWCIVMSQHAYVHTFTIRHAGIFYGLLAGPLLYLFVGSFKDFKTFILTKKILYVALVIYILFMFLTQQIWDNFIKNTFLI